MSLSPSTTAYLIFGLLMSGISSCLTSINFFITILNLRSYYFTLKTMPLFPWSLLITGGMLLLTNEFLGSYSNYKFIISFSMFNRMGFWGTLCLQSNIEEVLSLLFSIPIFLLWFYNSSSFLSSFSFF